jgi:hypothetical protein
MTSQCEHQNSNKTLPFNAMILLSHYLNKQSSFNHLQISTNPSLTVKTNISKDRTNPKKKIITRTTTFRRRELEPSFDSSHVNFEDRLSINESTLADITTQIEKDASFRANGSMEQIQTLIIRIQRHWRRRREINKTINSKYVKAVDVSKRDIYRDIIEQVTKLQRYTRRYLQRRQNINLIKIIIKKANEKIESIYNNRGNKLLKMRYNVIVFFSIFKSILEVHLIELRMRFFKSLSTLALTNYVYNH